MKDNFKAIKRIELKELLEAYHILAALECGGVDNWTWYGEARREYLNRWACETGRDEDYRMRKTGSGYNRSQD